MKTHRHGNTHGKNYWIFQDRLGVKMPGTTLDKNKLVWFLYYETADLYRKKWSGWLSQWDLENTFDTEKEALSYLTANGDI